MIQQENLVCPNCHYKLKFDVENFFCEKCQLQFKIKNNIPIFLQSPGYWCNVNRETMNQLINDSEKSGDWLNTAKRIIPKYTNAFIPYYRADAQFLFNVSKDSRVLDAGSMWGGLTIPIAQYCKEVYAVDQTWETLRFLQIRAKQLNLNNIILVVSPINKMPFPDNYFDYVVLNGVLEWLGVSQEVILDVHWKRKRKDKFTYKESPDKKQKEALKEIYRVLKPGGGIYVAIENRFGLQYFLGHPDDHMNIRFVTFMPRFIANFVTKLCRNTSYRTYIYSPKQLRRLISSAGFKNEKLYSVYPHYGKISRAIPFDIFTQYKKLATEGYSHIKIFLLTVVWRLFPGFLGKFLSPSLAITASKGDAYNCESRLLNALSTEKLIDKDKLNQYSIALVNNRFSNFNSTNYIVYNKQTKNIKFYCKIARNNDADILEKEALNLSKVNSVLVDTSLNDSVPLLYYNGKVDGITFQITNYLNAKSAHKGVLNALHRSGKFISESSKIFRLAHSVIKPLIRVLWLVKIDPLMSKAIDWLTIFHKTSSTEHFNFANDGAGWLDRQIPLIEQNGVDIQKHQRVIDSLKSKFKALHMLDVPLCMQHGDFDICNLLVLENGALKLIDFEHLEENQLPFFDLANLIFSPLILEWRQNYNNISLKKYISSTKWRHYLKKWIKYYFSKNNISIELLSIFPALAVIEQNSKLYCSARNPYDYPMFGQESLDNMLELSL